MTRRRFVLLDRDGTINEEREYLSDPAQVVLLPGAATGLRQMRALGLGLVVISNQAGIGRGKFDHAALDAVNARLHELLAAEGITLDGFYVCPHAPSEGCRCRKPAPGLVEDAARDLGFDPRDSFMIGDKAIDMALGRRVGATTILARTGYGAEQQKEAAADTDYVVDDLAAAAALIADTMRRMNATSPNRGAEG